MKQADVSPLIIIGNARSGTTMFRLMLTCHDQIVIPPESGFMFDLYERYKGMSGSVGEVEAFAQDVMKSSKFDNWRIPFDTLVQSLAARGPRNYAECVGAVYRCYGEVHQPGKTWWGDKNNYFLNHIETIAGIFPGARFLHVVRDGRDVACSYRSLGEVKGEHAPMLPKSVYGAANDWRRAIRGIRQGFDRIGWHKVHELRYEELVLQPEETLKGVCEFIGVDYCASMLQFHRENRRKDLEPVAFAAWKGRTRERLTSSRRNRWRREMFVEDVLLFESLAHRALTTYGYPLSSSPRPRMLDVLGLLFRSLIFFKKALGGEAVQKALRKPGKWLFRWRFNSEWCARFTGKTHLLCLGDSHVDVFKCIQKNKMSADLLLDVTAVPAATAQGGANPNSKTRALRIFRERLSRSRSFQDVLLLLGEVDAGFVIWFYSEKYGIPVDEQLRMSINNYAAFIKEVQERGFRRTIVMSAPLPTIVDGQDWGEIANLRKEVKASQLERTRMTRRFNQAMKEFCREQGVDFLDLDDRLIDEGTGLIKKRFRNPDLAEHHLNVEEYAKVVVKALERAWPASKTSS